MCFLFNSCYSLYGFFYTLDEDECYELFTKLKNDGPIFKITMAAVSFVDLVAAKCNKECEFTQFLITTLFSLPHERYK